MPKMVSMTIFLSNYVDLYITDAIKRVVSQKLKNDKVGKLKTFPCQLPLCLSGDTFTEIILLNVRTRYALSYRDLEEMMRTRHNRGSFDN